MKEPTPNDTEARISFSRGQHVKLLSLMHAKRKFDVRVRVCVTIRARGHCALRIIARGGSFSRAEPANFRVLQIIKFSSEEVTLTKRRLAKKLFIDAAVNEKSQRYLKEDVFPRALPWISEGKWGSIGLGS